MINTKKDQQYFKTSINAYTNHILLVRAVLASSVSYDGVSISNWPDLFLTDQHSKIFAVCLVTIFRHMYKN